MSRAGTPLFSCLNRSSAPSRFKLLPWAQTVPIDVLSALGSRLLGVPDSEEAKRPGGSEVSQSESDAPVSDPVESRNPLRCEADCATTDHCKSAPNISGTSF